MYDFLITGVKTPKRGVTEIYPRFKVGNVSDLMIRGGDFYAVWDEKTGLWTRDETLVMDMVDISLNEKKSLISKNNDDIVHIKYMWDSESGSVDKWHKYVQKQMRDSYHQLDENIIFANTETKKEDYASKKLPYPLSKGDISSYDELMSTLYSEKERDKIEWAIGSIFTGDSKKIQKFVVLYGSAGSGKSTVLNIIQMLFDGYYCFFDAKEIGSKNNTFALEPFKENPLVGIQHDGDLSRISDNTKLNSIVSHESMVINEKFKSTYSARFNTFLFMGTNKPVKITEAKSGLLRRLIDVQPTGNKIPFERYNYLMDKIQFELGSIADHCITKYRSMGRSYYNNYVPQQMMSDTNDFYDFMEAYYDDFERSQNITLKEAWTLYKTYCEYANVQFPFAMRDVRAELRNYYDSFIPDRIIDGKHVRNYYVGFLTEKFKHGFDNITEPVDNSWIELKSGVISEFDKACIDEPAQYAAFKETPLMKWDDVTSVLRDIDTGELHYVKVPKNHIVIDFDLKDSDGQKSLERNLEEANKWPKTYTEVSKSGSGIHLHYIYDGDPDKLSRMYEEDIEVKVFTGNSSLRRKLTKCNEEPIAHISSGLPLKGGKPVINFEAVKDEKHLRNIIKKNLRKEIHPATKPSVDLIFKVLEDAYHGGMKYDVSDMRPDVMQFAANSTHQSENCLKLVNKMQFKSDESSENVEPEEDALVFFDVEVYPNLFIIVWKFEGEDSKPVKMINPTPLEVENLLRFKLVGFNCRRYDNHILYARISGYDNQQLYNLSQRIINGSNNAMFGEAYNISYTDVYDFSSKKQSLKKFEIELGIHHMEMGLKWDEPVDEKDWETVAEYCTNDVIATEAVFHARHGDFVARQILAELADMNVNSSTNTLTGRIIFGTERHPQLEYVDLSKEFPGYEFSDDGKNIYKGYDVGFGGLVMANPGMYTNLITLDVASMHPTSVIQMNMFGDYTKNFDDLVKARLYIKHGDYDKAKKLFGGKLSRYLDDKDNAKALSNALKIAINSVYGLTAAKFDNPFRDPRNKNNIVALRGALMMYDLYNIVTEKGYQVVHIKTDSIKIANYDDKIVEVVREHGKKYGYTFEVEALWDKLCLVNDSVFIGLQSPDSPDKPGKWTAIGEQFKVPYVFKTLFSKEPIEFEDTCETKTVMTAMYLDMNEGKEEEHDYYFIGKAGSFCPIKPGCGGGILVREKGEDLYVKQMKQWEKTKKTKPAPDKFTAVGGTKGYRWLESEMVTNLKKEKDIDHDYYKELVDAAIVKINEFGDFEWFTEDVSI